MSVSPLCTGRACCIWGRMSSTKHRASIPWESCKQTKKWQAAVLLCFPLASIPCTPASGHGQHSTAVAKPPVSLGWKQHHNSMLHMGFSSKNKLCAEKQPGCFWRQSAQCDRHRCGSQGCGLDRLFPHSWPLGMELWTYHVTSLVTH